MPQPHEQGLSRLRHEQQQREFSTPLQVVLHIRSYEPLAVVLEVVDLAWQSPGNLGSGGGGGLGRRARTGSRASLDVNGRYIRHRSSGSFTRPPSVSPLTAQVQSAWLSGQGQSDVEGGSPPDHTNGFVAGTSAGASSSVGAGSSAGHLNGSLNQGGALPSPRNQPLVTHMGFPESLQESYDVRISKSAAQMDEETGASGAPPSEPEAPQPSCSQPQPQGNGNGQRQLPAASQPSLSLLSTSLRPNKSLGSLTSLDGLMQEARASALPLNHSSSTGALAQLEGEHQREQQLAGERLLEPAGASAEGAAASDVLGGYLGDSESRPGPRAVGSASLQPLLQGFEMSLCGSLLRKDMGPAEALQVRAPKHGQRPSSSQSASASRLLLVLQLPHFVPLSVPALAFTLLPYAVLC